MYGVLTQHHDDTAYLSKRTIPTLNSYEADAVNDKALAFFPGEVGAILLFATALGLASVFIAASACMCHPMKHTGVTHAPMRNSNNNCCCCCAGIQTVLLCIPYAWDLQRSNAGGARL